MFFIFGTKRKLYELANISINCPACKNLANQRIVKIKAWFVVFFIPLIPVSTKFMAVCSQCKRSYKLNKELLQKLILSGQYKQLGTQT